jgi:phenylpropionate dioxygenase-like ring-hydroxylating dioxygenase large terminal subunit
MTLTEEKRGTPVTVSSGRSKAGGITKDRYTSAEFAAQEAEHLWPYVWQIACRLEDLPTTGDFLEYQIAGQSILVVRSAPDIVKAYHNSCRHRGTQLKHDCGNAREIRCRYHAWRWNLDGSIKDVPDSSDFAAEDIDPACLALVECLVDTWGGFVFINMDLNAGSLAEFLGTVQERLARFEFEKMRTARFRSTVLASNWKTALDAFNESYHVAGTHPQVLRYHDDTNYVYEQHGIHSVFYPQPGSMGHPSPRLGSYRPDPSRTLLAMVEDIGAVDLLTEEERAMVGQMAEMAKDLPPEVSLGDFFANVRRQQGEMQGLDFSAFSDDDLLIGEDWNIFPNINTPSNGGNAFIFRFRPNGSDPDSCFIDIWSLQRFADGKEPPGKPKRELYEDWRQHDQWGRLLVQDFTNIPNVQKGMHSRAFTQLICGRQEANIENYHQALLSFMEGKR